MQPAAWHGGFAERLQLVRDLCDAVDGTITFINDRGKKYVLHDHTATLMPRPRGWHLVEKHVMVDGQPLSGSLFDFGLFFFHNAKNLMARGSGPYFYLPKMESHLEARLWNDVFVAAQEALDIPRGTIKATVLIETILAAFEMDEILHELREHSAGLNAGRWDYIFSIIKKHRNRAGFALPDRGDIGMTVPFMRAYTELMVHTCHKRGAHAIGGMAAFISQEDNFERQAKAFRSKLIHPVAADIDLKVRGINIYDVEPEKIPNLYHGMPVRIYGRWPASPPAASSHASSSP